MIKKIDNLQTALFLLVASATPANDLFDLINRGTRRD